MKLLKQASIIILMFLITGCNFNTEEIELKLNYKVDDTQTIIATTQTSKDALMSLKSVIETNFKVISIDNNNIVLDTNVANIKTEVKKENEIEVYDSNKEESKMTEDEKSIHEDLKKVLNHEFKTIIDKKGNIIKPLHYQNGKLVKEPVIDIGNIFLRLPSKKAKVGNGWQSKKKNPLTDQITTTTCRIKEINDSEIIISLELDITGIPGLFGDTTGNGEYKLEKSTSKLIKGYISIFFQ